ncbi:MAG: UDP-3-O-(3-hydroxymyristoyl)glucosamine N-acyltransferase [Bacteroidota bacterium]
MKFTANQIAEFLNGTIEGNSEVTVSTISRIEEGTEGSLSFISNPKYNKYIYSTNSSVVLINKDFVTEKEVKPTLIRVEDAYAAFAELLKLYDKNKFAGKNGIEKTACVSESVTFGENVFIGGLSYIGEKVRLGNNVKIFPHAFIGDNVQIGDNTVIRQGVNIYEDCVIGKNCMLHSGVVIGGDGFGFAPQPDGSYEKIPQIGNVIIENNVEIGANSTVDRATIGSTIIHDGVKIDNLIMIAHNVEVGENTVIVSQAGISGSTKIGKNCKIGGQVGMIGHIVIADGVEIAAQSGVGASITEPNSRVQGSPCFEVGKYRRSYVYFKKLPEIVKRLDNIEDNK